MTAEAILAEIRKWQTVEARQTGSLVKARAEIDKLKKRLATLTASIR